MYTYEHICNKYRKGGYPLKSWGKYGRVAGMSRREESRKKWYNCISVKIKNILTQLKKNEFTVY